MDDQSPRPGPLALAAATVCFATVLAGYSQFSAHVGVGRWETLEAVGLAVAIVTILQLMLRFRAALWLFALLPMLILLPQLDPRWATYWHGFMHSSIVYQIYDRGSPPENPLMAGEPLRYMYGHHAAIAWLMRIVPISPAQAFFLTDVLSLALFVWLMDRAARLVSSDRVFRVFTGFFALFAMSPFLRGPLALLVQHAWLGKRLVFRAEQRFIPLMKFVGINNNQLGLMFCALALFGLVSIGAGRERWRPAYVCVALAVVGAGIIYPPCWLSIVACAGVSAAYLLLQHQRSLRVAAGWLAGIVALGSAAVLPSMLGVTSGKTGSSSAIELTFNYGHIRENGAELVLLLILPALLAWICRKELLESYRRLPHVAGILLGCLAVNLVMYLLIFVPGPSEYKFVLTAVLVMSIPTAMALQILFSTKPAVAVAIMFLVAIPMTMDLVHQPPADTVADLVRSDGRNLRHTDPAQDALYRWIAQQTPVNAVFIDTYLTIPVLGHRQLLVGLDSRRAAGGLKGYLHDGWLITADEFLRNNTGVDPVRYAALKDAVGRLLATGPDPVDDTLLQRLQDYRRGRPMYVVARDEAVRARLAAAGQFRQVYQGGAGTIFEFPTTAILQ
jgi:hypothetical protein